MNKNIIEFLELIKQKINLKYQYVNQQRIKFNLENVDTDEIFYANKIYEMENPEIYLNNKYFQPF